MNYKLLLCTNKSILLSRNPQPYWAKYNKQPKVEESLSKADGSILTIVYLCLSLHNFSPIYPIAAVQTLNQAGVMEIHMLYVQGIMITTRHIKMVALE